MDCIYDKIISPNKVESLSKFQEVDKRIAFEINIDGVVCGFLRSKCLLNDERNIFLIETDFPVKDGTDKAFNSKFELQFKESCCILAEETVNYIELDEKTDFVKCDIKDIVEEGNYIIDDKVIVKTMGEEEQGKILRYGRFNNIFCYGIELISAGNNHLRCVVIKNNIFKFSEDLNTTCNTSLLSVREDYVLPRYTIPFGDGKGIQGNLNSCYLDTSIFSIFTFNLFLDNMLVDISGDDNIKELRNILSKAIVYPLRQCGYVSYMNVTKFRDKLQTLSPDGKFVINERDPEEFLEQLFQLLTPNKYLLRTKPFSDLKNEQKCFLTQLFYDCEEIKNINLLEMFTLTFLEFEMFISMPPKCLILQLPRDGRDLKKFKKIYIPSKLDITSFIVTCTKICKNCSTSGLNLYFCQKCSKIEVQMIYYCEDHKLHCTHEKISMPGEDIEYSGSVVLDLVSILCIERTHYISFVKTNHVSGQWIYFNSMEKIENGKFIPNVRATNLNEYFNNNKMGDFEYDKDVDKIEKYAFVCVYKYPCLEYYDSDFNSEI